MDYIQRSAVWGGEEDTEHVLGFVLLKQAKWNPTAYFRRLLRDWGIEPDGLSTQEDTLFFLAAGMQVRCTLMHWPLPGGFAESCCPYNSLWEESEQAIAGYASHLMISVSGCETPFEGYMLITQLACGWLLDKNALAFLFPGQQLILEPLYFVERAFSLQHGLFPAELWISFGIYESEFGLCGYTFGLEDFGKRELEILHMHGEEAQLFNLLYDIACYVIAENITLESGEVLSFSPDRRVQIALSEGEAVEGSSYKLSLLDF